MGNWDKVSAGSNIGDGPSNEAQFVNDTIDAINATKGVRLGTPLPVSGLATRNWSTDMIRVQNLTSANRLRGDAVQLGNYLLTNADWQNLWFEGNTVSDVGGRIAILKQEALTVVGMDPADIVFAQVSGICNANVNVTSTDHGYAMPVSGSENLASCSDGPIRIMQPLTSTGVQEITVLLAPGDPEAIVTPFDSSGSSVGKPIPVNASTGLIPAKGMTYTPPEDYTTTVYSNAFDCYIYVMDNPGGAATAGLALPFGQRYLGRYVGDAAADGKPVYSVHNYGPILKRFELTANLDYGTAPSSNNAVPLNFDGTNWTKDTGNPFKVYDPFFLAGGSSSGYSDFTGKAPISGKTGYQGWCVLAPDSGRYEIVYLEERAQFIDFTLTADMAVVSSTNQAAATVTAYHHGRDPDPGSAGITVYDPNKLAPRALNTAKGKAEWSDKKDRYEIVMCDQETLQYKGVCGALTQSTGSIPVGTLKRLNASPNGQKRVASTITAQNSLGWAGTGSSNVCIITWNDEDSQWEITSFAPTLVTPIVDLEANDPKLQIKTQDVLCYPNAAVSSLIDVDTGSDCP